MKIDRNMNIVLRLSDEDGNSIIAHHTPLPTLVFETQWKLLREVYDDLASAKVPSPILIKQILMDAATNLGRIRDAEDLLAQVRGATLVYTSQAELLDMADLSDDMKDEIVAKLLFFIVFRRHVFPSNLKGWLLNIQTALGMELTSSTAMDTFPSSTISTPVEPTGNTDISLAI